MRVTSIQQTVIVIRVEIVSRIEPEGGISRVTARQGSPGGLRLRSLRERAGKTQLWVELEAGLGTGYLQRVESGRVAQPARSTVERICDALAARFSERREVMELFGYVMSCTPPGDEDMVWARETARPELDTFPFPAYVLDCTTRLITWNRPVQALFGTREDDETLGGLAGKMLLAAWFDPRSALGRMVMEPEGFLPAMIHAFRHEMIQFHGEPWWDAVLAGLREQPVFRNWWDKAKAMPPRPSAARSLIPVRLALPGHGPVSFRIASEPFTRDARFRIIHYFPDDLETMRRCLSWNG